MRALENRIARLEGCYRYLRCQNALTAIIGPKGFFDALSDSKAGDRSSHSNTRGRPDLARLRTE
jgi:hypothetical protein